METCERPPNNLVHDNFVDEDLRLWASMIPMVLNQHLSGKNKGGGHRCCDLNLSREYRQLCAKGKRLKVALTTIMR